MLVGAVALVMIGVAVWYLRNFFRRDPEDEVAPAKWRGRALGQLVLDGRRSSAMGFLGRKASARLRIDRTKGRPASEALVGRLDIAFSAILAWIYASRTTLTTSERQVSLRGGGFMDWPWTFVPHVPHYTIEVDGERLGRFEIGATEVIGRDAAGEEIGRWQVGARLGAPMSDNAPRYGVLKLPGRASARLRVPRRRMLELKWFDFEGVPFLLDLEREEDDTTEVWLLAFVTLAAMASLLLLVRSPDGPRPINS